MLYARQMKAARALLDWSQQDLAQATNLSPTTIRNMESGDFSARSATVKIIQRIFEESGIEFIEGEGVRLRNDTVTIHQGNDSTELFFEDVMETLKQKGGEVICLFKSYDVLVQACEIMPGNMGQLTNMCQRTNVRCLVPSMLSTPKDLALVSRAIPKQYVGPSSYMVYGNKYAFILREGRNSVKFIVFSCPHIATEYKKYFEGLWEMASETYEDFKSFS